MSVTQIQLRSGHPHILPCRTIPQPNASEHVGDFHPVGTNVLHGRGARRAGNAGEAFDAAESRVHGSSDHGFPDGTGFCAQNPAVGVDVNVVAF